MTEPAPPRRRPGRPRTAAAASHKTVMDAVQALLEERPLRDLTMDAVAKRAAVGKPTLYRWWPTRTALVLAMFRERLVPEVDLQRAASAEAGLRQRVRRLISQFEGGFGKVMADLIAEGQAEPEILSELYSSHLQVRRAATIAEVEGGVQAGEFRPDLDPELLVDSLFGAIYYRLLLRSGPLTAEYGDQLLDQVLAGTRATDGREPSR